MNGANTLFTNRTSVLLILPQEVLDRARAFAGKATTSLKLPVSLQIVLRALIEEGLKWRTDPDLLVNVERQARMVREIRRRKQHAGRNAASHGKRPPPTRRRARAE